MPDFLTAAFYQFVELPDYADLQAPLLACCEALGVKGMVLLATEGINGTIAGPPTSVHAVLAWLRSDPRLAQLQHKEALAPSDPFYRMKVRLKREIVTLGVPGVNPSRMAGQYVKPADWNALISDPDVVLVDTRNEYEVGIGSFQGAINPHIDSFAAFPQWVAQARADGQPLAAKPRVAMFCTGGIRCEKSTAFLRAQGFDEVYHLEGGILKYLETVPESDSLWNGQCFVFDERVSVGHGLVPGGLELCRSCRRPLTEADKASPHFVRGVSCAHCFDQTTEAQKAGYLEREKQMALAEQRQQPHVGAKLPAPKK